MSRVRTEQSPTSIRRSPLLRSPPDETAERSLPSINPESERRQLDERALQKLLQHNREYLAQKVRVCDVRKPSRYAYKMPSKTGHSEYSRIYARSLPAADAHGTTPDRTRIANDLRLPDNGITNYQSTYSLEFAQRKHQDLLRRLQQARPKGYEREDGPFFTETSYHRDYHPHLASQAETVKPGDHITTGGKFSQDTTYAQHYTSSPHPSPPPAPVHHKDHSIFVKIGKPKQSSYQLSYLSSGRPRVEESCRPVTKLAPVLTKLKYRTEYTEKYVEQAGTERTDFQCLDSEQLKHYVLNILNH